MGLLPLLLWSEWGSSKRQWNLPASIAGRFCWDDRVGRIVTDLVKLADNIDNIHNHVENINPVISERSLLLYLWVFLLYCATVSSFMPSAWVPQGHSRTYWFIQVWQLSNLGLKVFSRQLSIKVMRYENGMLILGHNYIFFCHSVVRFSERFLQPRPCFC